MFVWSSGDCPSYDVYEYMNCNSVKTSDSSFYGLYEGLSYHFDGKEQGIFNSHISCSHCTNRHQSYIILQTSKEIHLSPFVGVHQRRPRRQLWASCLFWHGCHPIQSSSTCFPMWSRVLAQELCNSLKVSALHSQLHSRLMLWQMKECLWKNGVHRSTGVLQIWRICWRDCVEQKLYTL